jgi:levansucrase
MPNVAHHTPMPVPAVKSSRWCAEHLAEMRTPTENIIPLISAADVKPLLPGHDLWDLWPIQLDDGSKAVISDSSVWMILSAPKVPNPFDRHGVARIRLMQLKGTAWHDLGYFLPDALCPGQREWAGSAVYDPSTGRVTLYYTVAGRRSDTAVRYEQRIFEVSAKLNTDAGHIVCSDWETPHEIIVAEREHYMRVDGSESEPGFIKGFRDPAFFRDPADGKAYIVFTGSRAHSSHRFNGVIGIATAPKTGEVLWQTLPPLIDADSLNNELERPHLIHYRGLYYVFWSTQQAMFDPSGPTGPTALYGMVADSVLGPYQPLNGSGLVAATPAAEPRQSYSWWVCDDLSVVSFVDHWGLSGRSISDDLVLNRAQFGGTPAPVFKLSLDGNCAKIDTV